jgi:hypothetical protein
MRLALCAGLVLFVVGSEDGIRCSNGAFMHDCPNSAPVCCFNNDGTPAGCCSADMMCNGDEGCKPALPIPSNYSKGAEQDIAEDVHLPISRIMEAIGVMLAVLVVTFAAAFGCLTLKRWRLEQQERREREAERVSSSDDDDVTSQAEAAFNDELRLRELDDTDESNDEAGSLVRCIKCTRESVNCLFLPCEHTVACVGCAAHLKRCPECKQLIRKRKKLYVVA